jgi:hypothetical protein
MALKVNQSAAEAISDRRRRIEPLAQIFRRNTNLGQSLSKLVPQEALEDKENKSRAHWTIEEGRLTLKRGASRQK